MYGWLNFGEAQADEYLNSLNELFEILAEHNIGTPRPELDDDIFALPSGRHTIFFIDTSDVVVVIRVLHQSQDIPRHIYWR